MCSSMMTITTAITIDRTVNFVVRVITGGGRKLATRIHGDRAGRAAFGRANSGLLAFQKNETGKSDKSDLSVKSGTALA